METLVLTVNTRDKTQLIDITRDIEKQINTQGIQNGLCFLFVPHTTAGITINENADPTVPSDMLNVLNKIIPWDLNYKHLEGNSPAHVKSTLVGVSEIVAIENARLALGTWQGIFFCEFDGPRTRHVHVRLLQDH